MKWATRIHSWIWLLIMQHTFASVCVCVWIVLFWMDDFMFQAFISFGQCFESRERAKEIDGKKWVSFQRKFPCSEKVFIAQNLKFSWHKKCTTFDFLCYYQYLVQCFEFIFFFLLFWWRELKWNFAENFNPIHLSYHSDEFYISSFNQFNQMRLTVKHVG